VDAFGAAARRAKAAGFDGIEVHGANGYLIDQFYNDCANQRSAPYGGSLNNRSRFAREILEQVTQVFDSGNVGYRISPLNSYQDMKHSDPVAYTEHVAALCNEFKLGYLHVMRADFFGIQKGDVITPARGAFQGALIVNTGYTAEEGNAGVAEGSYDAVAFGTKILANPDFVHRVKNGEALNDPNPATFYKKTTVGYTDYPFSDSFNSNA
jgi:N-ethylmaleimide reductase